MARGGGDMGSTAGLLAALDRLQPLDDHPDPSCDAWGRPLHLLGWALLDEIGSRTRPGDLREALWQPLLQAFPAAQRTSGDMLLMAWDDPAEVQRLRERIEGLPFRMAVACGLQSRWPDSSLMVYKTQSLGRMLFDAERDAKQGNGFVWAGCSALSRQLQAGDGAWLGTISFERGSTLHEHASAHHYATAQLECERLERELEQGEVRRGQVMRTRDDVRLLRRHLARARKDRALAQRLAALTS
jgi:hypothetical protein